MKRHLSPWVLAPVLAALLVALAWLGVTLRLDALARDMGLEGVSWRLLLSFSPLEDGQQERLHAIVWDVRVPRVLLAALVGAALALAGAAMQAVFQNPLADPYIVGVASGAGLGAALSTALRLPAQWGPFDSNPVAVFLGGVLAAVVVYALAHRHGRIAVIHLLLIGVAISALCGGLTSYLLWFQKDLQRIFFLLMGTLSMADSGDVLLLAPVVLIGLAALQLAARALDVLQLGDDTASLLGLSAQRVRELALGVGVLLAALAVATSGVIGFIGLIVPHIVRLIVGPLHHRLVPCAALGGAVLLLAADTAARALHTAEVPVGIITTFLGVPFFLFLLRHGKL